MGTGEICNVLLAGVLGQVDVAVFQDKNMFVHRLLHHAQIPALHVTTPALIRLSLADATILTMNA